MPHVVASDLGLHCLLMSLYWDTTHKWATTELFHLFQIHPFIQKYKDESTHIIAAWVTEQLTEQYRKLHGEQS